MTQQFTTIWKGDRDLRWGVTGFGNDQDHIILGDGNLTDVVFLGLG